MNTQMIDKERGIEAIYPKGILIDRIAHTLMAAMSPYSSQFLKIFL